MNILNHAEYMKLALLYDLTTRIEANVTHKAKTHVCVKFVWIS